VEDHDEHRYRLAGWLPVAWLVGGTAVGTIGGQGFVRALIGAAVLTGAFTALGLLGFWELVLSPVGVRYRKREVRWSQLSLTRGRWRAVLRTSGLPLKESVVVALRTYRWDWERSPLGDDLRRWAPRLFDPTAPDDEEQP
jgi:hypothetical protein